MVFFLKIRLLICGYRYFVLIRYLFCGNRCVVLFVRALAKVDRFQALLANDAARPLAVVWARPSDLA